MITFTQIVSCNGTVLYDTIDNKLSFVSSGKLSVYLAYDGMILLKLNDFEYGIEQEHAILYDDKDPQFNLVFYLRKYPQGQWILKINQNSDSVYSCLNQKCYLKNKSPNFVKEANQYQQGKAYPNKQEEIMVEAPNQENQKQFKPSQFFVEGSKTIGKGLTFAGKMISQGLSSFGQYISKKVEPSEQKVEVSSNTKQNLKLAAKTTKNVLTFTAEQVGNLFNFGKKVASDVGERFQKTERGENMKKHQYYETVKDGAKNGVKVIANLYDGVVNAVYSVGSGVANGTTKVIGAKYGSQAEEAADEAFSGAGNVVKILRVPEDQAAKAFK